MTERKALIVDDESPIRRFLRAALGAQGYRTVEAGSVHEAIAKATTELPDVVILDLGLPDGDGTQVVQSLRSWTQVPILILSVRGSDSDKIAALDAGADDYLTKPFSTGELLARLRAALRRTAKPDEEPVVITGALKIDFPNHRVSLGSDEVHLTSTEYGLLTAMALHAGKVLTHKQLLQIVWGPGYESDTHMLRVNISNLRRKIEPTPVRPSYIITEPGVGYRLRVEAGTEER